MVTEAQQRANIKYRKKAYDRLEVTIPKGKKEIIKDFAESNGESLNAFINRLIDEALANKKDA